MRRRISGHQGPLQWLFQKPGILFGPQIKGIRDDWADANGSEYAGRFYEGDSPSAPQGYEVPTVHLDKLAVSPLELVRHLNHKSAASSRYAWRESFFVSLQILIQR